MRAWKTAVYPSSLGHLVINGGRTGWRRSLMLLRTRRIIARWVRSDETNRARAALIDSIRTNYEIPATFDGELPGTLIEQAAIPRLRIGQHYLVPDGTGAEVPGRLTSATVLEAEKLVYGVYELDDGRHIMATNTLTEEELEDYRRYPETFFDAVTPVGAKVRTFVEKCDFLFKTYQHSPREKLLEFMFKAQDIDHLRTLEQGDLAIIYCERMAQAMQSHEGAHTTTNGPA